MKVKRLLIVLALVLMTPNALLALQSPVRNKYSEPRLKDVHCLAKNIYHEARGEPLEGQLAVAQVTMNRLRHPNFAGSVCGVVYEYKQFSWTLEKPKKIADQRAWDSAIKLSKLVLSNQVENPKLKTALYFHTRQIRPYWSKGKRIVAVIGNHIFYS